MKFNRAKAEKLARIEAILRPDMACRRTKLHFDFLSDELRERFGVFETDNVSAHGYDQFSNELISTFDTGLVLDCGAGKRSDYLPNVVNLEIAPYESTDVLAVGERLPFIDGCFDAVLSLNVLEHVRDPCLCAAEISRVLKPGGKLYCVVPFLQPLHGYPDHYYNMTSSGLKNLFTDHLQIDDQQVIASGLPIWALSWMLGSWHAGLPAEQQAKFRAMTVAELMADPVSQLGQPHVQLLTAEKNFELASTTALFATKSG